MDTSIAQPHIILDYANFIIHEAGHPLFSGFGELMHMLGGTILQLLVPIIFAVFFILREEFFSFGFCIFWIGDNLINVSVYIGDARKMILPIVGDGHDWNWILNYLNLLDKDLLIARWVYFLGSVFIVLSLLFLLMLFILRIYNKLRPKTIIHA